MSNENDFHNSNKVFQVQLTPSQYSFLKKMMPPEYLLDTYTKPAKKEVPPPSLSKKPSVAELPVSTSIPAPITSVPLKKAVSSKPDTGTMISLEIPSTIKKQMSSIEAPPPQIQMLKRAASQAQPNPSQTQIHIPIQIQTQAPPQTITPTPVQTQAQPKPQPQESILASSLGPTQLQIKKEPSIPQIEKKPSMGPPSPAATSSKSSHKPANELMRKCAHILHKLKKHQYAQPFLYPVDVVGLGLHDYLQIIKEPMDISTVEKRLKNDEYPTPVQFAADVRKIWKNAMTYNAEGSPIYLQTVEMKNYFDRLFKEVEDLLPPPPPVQEPFDPEKKIKKIYKQISALHHKGGKFTLVDSQPPKEEPFTGAEKKKLYQNIHRLPMSHLRGVVDIVNEFLNIEKGNVIELDLETLPDEIIRKLDRFVSFQINVLTKSEQRHKNKLNNKSVGMKIEFGDKPGKKDDDTSVSSFDSDSDGQVEDDD